MIMELHFVFMSNGNDWGYSFVGGGNFGQVIAHFKEDADHKVVMFDLFLAP